MNIEIWTATTSPDVLEQIDRMLPHLIDDDEMRRILERNRRFRSNSGRGGTRRSTRGNQGTRALGVSLVVMGIAMLIPGPVDLAFVAAGAAIGGFFGGPAGAALGAKIGLIVYNAAAVAVVIAGLVLIVASYLGA
tara:strand:+ start:1271 stop:1675 length:405 start_codon:yes stop_codon:yes gene_type:complete